jgi:hypothetical protein
LFVLNKFSSPEEVRRMQCASCGEKIKGKPVWKDDKPYCSDECADMGPIEGEEEDLEEEEEDK